LLGHFSSRYKDLDLLLNEARAVFPATEISQEGSTYVIDQRSIV
jgi:ribonuclease Z